MIPVSLCTSLHIGISSSLAFSLPQSFVAAKRRQNPAPSSEGAEAATAAKPLIYSALLTSAFSLTLSRSAPLYPEAPCPQEIPRTRRRPLSFIEKEKTKFFLSLIPSRSAPLYPEAPYPQGIPRMRRRPLSFIEKEKTKFFLSLIPSHSAPLCPEAPCPQEIPGTRRRR